MKRKCLNLECGWVWDAIQGESGYCPRCDGDSSAMAATGDITVDGRVFGGTPVQPPFVVASGSFAQRRYLPTLSDLVDRLSIVQLKAVFIPEKRAEYMKERADIEHDIDLIIKEKGIVFDARAVHAVLMVMLANRFIWENESKAREGGSEQDRLLKLTHSINGVRNVAKNQLAAVDGGRMDYKTDCFAAELVEDFGNWNVFS